MLLTLTISAMANSQTNLPTEPPNWWHTKTDLEKYKLLKSAHDIAIEQNKKLVELNTELEKTIEQETECIELIKENTKHLVTPPRWAFSIGASAGVLADLHEDAHHMISPKIGVNLCFYRFFLKGRLFFLYGGNLQLYRDLGGSVELGFGVVIK